MMKQHDYIKFDLDGQTIDLEFNKPHWSDNEDNFLKCVSGYYLDHNGKPVYYKNDLID